MALLVTLETSTTASRTIPDQWHFCESQEDADAWVEARKIENDRFNQSPGVVSWRTVYAEIYNEERQKNLSLGDLISMPIHMLAVLLRSVS